MNLISQGYRDVKLVYLVRVLLFVLFSITMGSAEDKKFPIPQIDFNPEKYVCYRVSDPLEIDGELDEDDWQNAVRTKYFVDIEGSLKPRPRFWTNVKMLWDENYFYIGAQLQEPHIWATLKERDTIIYQDNDFEVFIDPDGNSHNYYEVEINAFGAFWDLMLVKPYRDGGPAINAWDIYRIKVAVTLDGTINNPSDIDSHWQVEMAIPWDVLGEGTTMASPPKDGDFWRINFSRVVWPMETSGGKYIKFKDRKTGITAANLNWVWSPQGLINMHYPEMWGYVHFTDNIVGKEIAEYKLPHSEKIKWFLRQIYYEEKNYFVKNNKYTAELSDLDEKILSQIGSKLPPEIQTTWNMFESTLKDSTTGSIWHIRQDGLIWKSE